MTGWLATCSPRVSLSARRPSVGSRSGATVPLLQSDTAVSMAFYCASHTGSDVCFLRRDRILGAAGRNDPSSVCIRYMLDLPIRERPVTGY